MVKRKEKEKIKNYKNNEKNPLFEYTGTDSIGNLAQNIDEELYGP